MSVRGEYMIKQRLVKLALPSDLVVAMDAYINGSASYNGRQDFVADAIANLLADLEVGSAATGLSESRREAALVTGGAAVAAPRAVVDSPEQAGVSIQAATHKQVESFESSTALALAEISFPSDGVLRTEGFAPPQQEPTWGIHNRDFPTLWAAGMLSRELSSADTVDYQRWLADTVEIAWRLAVSLADSDIDLSGFPMNLEKAEKSESRFVRFFLGETAGKGPLFELGLASEVEPDRVALTLDGAGVLAQLEGWTPSLTEPPTSEIADVFLNHLHCRVPADFEFMKEIIDLINEGLNDRDTLITEIGSRNKSWPSGVTATNVAGFIGRSRQWGLIERRQKDRRYELRQGALSAIHRFDDRQNEEQGK